jgi:hypothetical protein
MEPPEYRSSFALEILAASLATRLTLEELDWLSRELARRTEAQRYDEDQIKQGEPLAPDTYRDAWEPL